MEAAEVTPGAPPTILASDREVVRLGESVFRTGRLSPEAIDLACAVLARMAAKYAPLKVSATRAVATSSIRDARNRAEFLECASAAAGVPVEVISGREEARLIHLGVASRWPGVGHRVLIIDIGGGSAEIIASEGPHMRQAVSQPLGAIRLKEMFLEHDPPLESELAQLHAYTEERLAGVVRRFGLGDWDRAVATSGTAAAVAYAINGVPRAGRDREDRLRASTAQVRSLFRKLSGLDLQGRRKVSGIGPRRAEIIVPGVAVLLSILEAFEMSAVYYSAAGVRDGVIADLAARGAGVDTTSLRGDERRDVEQMSARYGVSRPHARKVAALAASLFQQLQPLHQLPPPWLRLLEAAAFLHDVGHFIADSGHHKHSYYIVSNSDMPGFTGRERELIANLCRYHRKALPSARHMNQRSLTEDERKSLLLLIPLLRLADSLDRSHSQRVESVGCTVADAGVMVQIYSSDDTSLEEWAALRVSELFRIIYRRPLTVVRAAVNPRKQTQ